MNITGTLTELPRWSDYYVKESVSDEDQGQDMDGVQGLEASPAHMPEETAWDLKVRSARLVERALMSKDIRALYDRASATPSVGNKLGPWVVAFKRDREFKAACCPGKRKIIINVNCSDDEALDSLVFELTNAIFSEKYLTWDEKVRSGQMPCEKYVKKTERQEFENTILHSVVMRNAITEMGWSNALDYYGKYHEELRKIVEQSNGGVRLELKDLHREMFEQYWIRQKNTTHADFYRKQWELLAPINMQRDIYYMAKTYNRIAIAVGSCFILWKMTKKLRSASKAIV